jgi:hypothetical protein
MAQGREQLGPFLQSQGVGRAGPFGGGDGAAQGGRTRWLPSCAGLGRRDYENPAVKARSGVLVPQSRTSPQRPVVRGLT